MSTAIASTPETQAASELPARLWRDYRFQRREGARQSVAASMALEGSGFTSQRGREAMRTALIEREELSGLALSPEELEAEIIAEAATVDNAEPEPGSAAAIEADARQRVAELRAQIERMSPESLSDAAVAAEQRDAESQLADAERALVNVERARREVGRRDVDAAERAEAERRATATAEAAKLEPVIAKAKAEVDAAAREWVERVVVLRDAVEARAAQVAVAMPNDVMAVRSARFRDGEVVASLRHALRGHIRLDELEGPGLPAPLVAAEPGGA